MWQGNVNVNSLSPLFIFVDSRDKCSGMRRFSSDGVSKALNFNSADSNIDRFNKAYNPSGATTYGFKGFPENNMLQPKLPLRHQPSADITSDVNRYFRKDSPPDWNQGQNPPPRMASPPPPPQERKPEPNWLEPKRNSPPPAMPPPEHLNQTISPRYQDEQPSYRKEPVIRDPFKQLSSAEKRKKIDEFYVAEEDLAMARQRKEKEKYDKIEEQRKMKYGEENRGMERVRTDLEKRPMPERKEDILRQQEQEIIDLRRSLNHLEREQRGNATPQYEPSNNRMEMLEDQAKMMKHLEGEIDRLRAQDDMAYRRDDRQYEPRAQSDIPSISVASSPLYVFTAKPNTLHRKNLVGFLFPKEPQTDRVYNRRPNRDREIFGQSKPSVPEYLNVSPRRHPVGRLYNKDSTYKTDFDVPFGKHGPHNLGNPNKEPMEPYNPFGMEGGGAPMVDAVGQRRTRIAGSMAYLGREMSDSARARRAHKRELLQEIGEQAAFERARREREKAYNRQEFVEVADAIRQKKVGYPRFNPNGLISQHHHLPHMFNTVPYAERMEQKKYHDFLERQIEDRNAMTRIGQFEEQRQAKEHYRTIDGFFGRRGGGNVKGPDTRKINLEKAIHNPQSTTNYSGRTPYAAEF